MKKNYSSQTQENNLWRETFLEHREQIASKVTENLKEELKRLDQVKIDASFLKAPIQAAIYYVLCEADESVGYQYILSNEALSHYDHLVRNTVTQHNNNRFFAYFDWDDVELFYNSMGKFEEMTPRQQTVHLKEFSEKFELSETISMGFDFEKSEPFFFYKGNEIDVAAFALVHDQLEDIRNLNLSNSKNRIWSYDKFRIMFKTGDVKL